MLNKNTTKNQGKANDKEKGFERRNKTENQKTERTEGKKASI